jgi:hypothetical protein
VTAAPKPTKRPKRNPCRLWAAERAAWLLDHPNCQAGEYGLLTACSGGIQVHHRTPRGAGGSRETLPLASLCLVHHAHVEANREEARTLGLLVRRGGGGK